MADHHHRFLEYLEKFLPYLKPKTYNIITRVVVGTGLFLCVDAKLGILDYILIVASETAFGSGDYVRGALENTNYNPVAGIILVALGLSYHAAVTVGVAAASNAESNAKRPEFDLAFLDQDEARYAQDVKCRGTLCVGPYEELPDYRAPRDPFDIAPSVTRRANLDLYRERAEILRVWGGAEVLTLSIENVSETVARNVRVEITAERNKTRELSNVNEYIPEIPKAERDIVDFAAFNTPEYDIKGAHTWQEFFFEWRAGDIQAKQSARARTKVFVRTEEVFSITIKIYCDELAKPVTKSLKVHPPEARRQLKKADVIEGDKRFSELLDEVFMDRFVSREARRYVDSMDV